MNLLAPVLIALIGLLLWAFASNPKLAEAGRLAFFAGLLVTTFLLGDARIELFGG